MYACFMGYSYPEENKTHLSMCLHVKNKLKNKKILHCPNRSNRKIIERCKRHDRYPYHIYKWRCTFLACNRHFSGGDRLVLARISPLSEIKVIRPWISKLVHTTCFCNNRHRIRSNSTDRKVKYIKSRIKFPTVKP